jgi:ribonucleotide monophosphatase NagD (HAD superfamily)
MDGLRSALFDDGYFVEDEEHPAFVVVGMDFEVTYRRLRKACLLIRAGARFHRHQSRHNLSGGGRDRTGVRRTAGTPARQH